MNRPSPSMYRSDVDAYSATEHRFKDPFGPAPGKVGRNSLRGLGTWWVQPRPRAPPCGRKRRGTADDGAECARAPAGRADHGALGGGCSGRTVECAGGRAGGTSGAKRPEAGDASDPGDASGAKAARNAAQAAQSSIPNGLRPGGLRVAPGAVPGSDLWQGAGLPTETVTGAQTEVTVKQNQQKAILTWETFNVGKQTALYFNQSAGTGADGSNAWMVLNRVLDPAAAPSRIFWIDQGGRPSLYRQSERHHFRWRFPDQCRNVGRVHAQYPGCNLQRHACRYAMGSVRGSGIFHQWTCRRREGRARREDHRRAWRPGRAAWPERKQFRRVTGG